MKLKQFLRACFSDYFESESEVEIRIRILLAKLGYLSSARQQVVVRRVDRDRSVGRMDVVVEVDGVCLLIFELKNTNHPSKRLSSGFDQLREYSIGVTAEQGRPPKLVVLSNGKCLIAYEPSADGDIAGSFDSSPNFRKQIDFDEKGAAGQIRSLMKRSVLTSAQFDVEMAACVKEIERKEQRIERLVSFASDDGWTPEELAKLQRSLSVVSEPESARPSEMNATIFGDAVREIIGSGKFVSFRLTADGESRTMDDLPRAKAHWTKGAYLVNDSVVAANPIQDNAELYQRLIDDGICKPVDGLDVGGSANQYRFPNCVQNIGQSAHHLPAKYAAVLSVFGYDLDEAVFTCDNGEEISVARLVECATIQTRTRSNGPEWMELFGDRFHPSSWSAALVQVVSEMNERHSESFRDRMLTVPRWKGAGCKLVHDLRSGPVPNGQYPTEIPDDMLMYRGYGADGTPEIVDLVLTAFGYVPSEIVAWSQ